MSSPERDAWVERTQARLAQVELLQQRHDQLRGDPPSGSDAATEWCTRGGAFAYNHADGLLSCSLDHLIALSELLNGAGVLPAFGCMTLLRGAYEPALVARWALDGTGSDRLGRGLSLQWDDLQHRLKLEMSLGHGELAQRRLDELSVLAADCGTLRDDKKGRPYLVPTVPSITDLASAFPTPGADPDRPEEWIYRVLSGYAHGKQWARTLGATPGTHGATGTVTAEVTADGERLYWLTERVWAQVLEAHRTLERLWFPDM